jgi:hypothetical protein
MKYMLQVEATDWAGYWLYWDGPFQRSIADTKLTQTQNHPNNSRT